MNDNLAQHSAQTPSPSTGSRQETHSVGSAMSSANRAVCAHAPRATFSAPRKWPKMERVGDASASMGERLALSGAGLKQQGDGQIKATHPETALLSRILLNLLLQALAQKAPTAMAGPKSAGTTIGQPKTSTHARVSNQEGSRSP